MSAPEIPAPGVEKPRLGSYRLVEPLGSGGMSSVFRAVHTESGHEVAIKILPRSLAENHLLLQRFISEARHAECLQHPNIVELYDLGFDKHRPYLILEYVAGGDLHSRVRRSGPLSITEAANAILSVARGLEFAWKHGIIHRDIKPANLLVSPDGRVKITDLGLSIQEDDLERHTREGTTVGTVDYMAPEQARDSRSTSVQSDMYSLGCTLHFLLTGFPPFPVSDLTEKLQAHAFEAPPDIRRRRAEVPATLATLLQRLMAKQPRDRFPDYASLIAALEPFSDDVALEEIEETPAGRPLASLPPPRNIEPRPPTDSLPPRSTVEPRTSDELVLQPLPPNLSSLAELANANHSSHEEQARAVPPAPRDRATTTTPPPETTRSTRSQLENEIPLLNFILAGLGIGFMLIVLGLAFRELIVWREDAKLDQPVLVEPGEIETEPIVEVPRPVLPTPKERTVRNDSPRAGPPPRPSWTEPPDFDPALAPEPSYPASLLNLFQAWDAIVPVNVPGPTVRVRRADLLSTTDRLTSASLHRAFETLGGTTEILDNGPFFEASWKLGAKPRHIKAGPGYRPMLVLDPFSLESRATNSPSSLVRVESSILILEGLDVVIQARGLVPSISSVFECLGKVDWLVLRDCSFTFVGLENRSLDLVRVVRDPTTPDSPAHSIVIDRCLVRSLASSLVNVVGANCAILVRSSVAGCGNRPVIQANQGRFGMDFIRSILMSSSAVLQRGGGGELRGIQALGSTFARIGRQATASITWDGRSQPSPDPFWKGGYNHFVGWPLTPPTRESSRITPNPWPIGLANDRLTLEAVRGVSFDTPSILTRVRNPGRFLREQTIETFEPYPVPSMVDLTTQLGGTASEGPQENSQSQRPEMGGGTDKSRPTGPGVNAADPFEEGEVALFNLGDTRWSGDLGAFLQSRFRPGLKLLEVRVVGQGQFRSTSVTLPRGLSLEISTIPGATAGAPPVIWTPRAGPFLKSLDGSVQLQGFGLTQDSRSESPLLQLDRSSLVMTACRLTGAENNSSGGASRERPLIQFRATTTQPIDQEPRKRSAIHGDRPAMMLSKSLLLSAGTAIQAELARGALWLEQCGIVAGEVAFDLRAVPVRRDRFQADLVLDRTTIAAATSIVQTSAWVGLPPGPDRPWLIASRSCLFVDAFQRERRTTALLRSDSGGLDRSLISWQSLNDSYQLNNFVMLQPSEGSATVRPDLNFHWIDLWGRAHVRSPSGPTLRSPRPTIRPLGGPIVVGKERPENLLMERWSAPGIVVTDQGLDPSVVGIGVGSTP